MILSSYGGRLLKDFLLDLDATSLANKIKHKEISSEEVVNTYINHIKHGQPKINAVVEERFSLALQEARKIDQYLKKYHPPEGRPLYGVPISIKESFHVQGMRTTGGLINRKENIAQSDAYVVKKLKKAGAVILCKTNTPALCFCQETDNKLYGKTNNPWDITRTAGGSSGGEGALLAIGGSAAGIGSDIGGSIRFPSHANGVIGFKPGKFQVPDTGHFPTEHIPLQKQMSAIGPLGKSVRDIELIYDIIAEYQKTDQTLADMKIQLLPDEVPYPLSPKTTEVLLAIHASLRTTFNIEQKFPPFFHESALLWQNIMSIDGARNIKDYIFANQRGNIFHEYIKEILTNRSQLHKYLSWALIGASLFKPSHSKIKKIKHTIKSGMYKLNHYLKDRLLILPVYHTAAPHHGKLYQEIFSIRKTFKKYMPYVAYANVWGLPSLTIPVGEDENHLPISIQIISRNGNEAIIFELGKILEKQFRGYIRCKQFDLNA